MNRPTLRLRIDGTPIKNVIQHDRCGDCGMGLCDPMEWHPYEACVNFKQTHDSGQVWALLHNRAKFGEKPW